MCHHTCVAILISFAFQAVLVEMKFVGVLRRRVRKANSVSAKRKEESMTSNTAKGGAA